MQVLKTIFWLVLSGLCVLVATGLCVGMVVFDIEVMRTAVLTHDCMIGLFAFLVALPIANSLIVLYELHERAQTYIIYNLIKSQKE